MHLIIQTCQLTVYSISCFSLTVFPYKDSFMSPVCLLLHIWFKSTNNSVSGFSLPNVYLVRIPTFRSWFSPPFVVAGFSPPTVVAGFSPPTFLYIGSVCPPLYISGSIISLSVFSRSGSGKMYVFIWVQSSFLDLGTYVTPGLYCPDST